MNFKRFLVWECILILLLLILPLSTKGQEGEPYRTFLPSLTNNVVVTTNPPLHHYIGLVAVEHDIARDYYTVRGDGSEMELLVADATQLAWSPDGAYLFYTIGEEVRLIEMATRESTLVLKGMVYGLNWAPNSQMIAFVSDAPNQQLYRYEVKQSTLTTISLNARFDSRLADWAPDSQSFIWQDLKAHTSAPCYCIAHLWMLPRNTTTPQLVYLREGYEVLNGEWSPDGSRYLFTGANGKDNLEAVYGTDRVGSLATLLISNYTMWGWIDGGARLLLWQSATQALYVARVDGTTPTLFAEDVYPLSVSPAGDKVLFQSVGEPDFWLQATHSPTPVRLNNHCGYRVTWRTDGEMFACTGGAPFVTTIGVTTPSPEIIYELQSYIEPHFLPLSANYISMQNVEYNPDTGNGTFRGMYLLGVNGDSLRWSPSDPVLEWRYMP